MPLLYKMWMGGKIIVCPVLQDKISLAAQDRVFPVENLVRKGIYALQFVWRIGENEIESAVADIQEIENVTVDGTDFLQSQAFVHFADERGVLAVHFHANGFFPASGDEFGTDASRSSEKVQEAESLQFIFAFQDVEQPFLGKIGGRPGRIACRRVYGFPFKFSSDYSHYVSRGRALCP